MTNKIKMKKGDRVLFVLPEAVEMMRKEYGFRTERKRKARKTTTKTKNKQPEVVSDESGTE